MPIYDSKCVIHNGDIGHDENEPSADCLDLGHSSMIEGLHIIITETFVMPVEVSNFLIWIMGGDSGPDFPIIARIFFPPAFIPIFALEEGKHYFLPCCNIPARYWGAYFETYSETMDKFPTEGKVLMYFGPNEDGTE